MTGFVWSLPALVVIALLAGGRVGVLRAALAGTLVALAVALASAPQPFTAGQALVALGRGMWIGWSVLPYVLGGLLFWQLAARPPAGDQSARAAGPPQASTDGPSAAQAMASAAGPPYARTAAPVVGPSSAQAAPGGSRADRRLLFTACFLVGPFAESATGFGVGMIGTLALIRHLPLRPGHLLAFTLLSQTLIPWGAMASGTLIGASYARTTPTALALDSGLLLAAVMVPWLALFWRLARQAGLGAGAGECLRETGWIAVALTLLLTATRLLGAEIALLAAYGPLIVIHQVITRRPSPRALATAARQVLPYAVLIGCLVSARLLPGVRQTLAGIGRLQPFADLPAWSPLLHAGSWLLAVGIATALLRGRGRQLPRELLTAWRTGRPAILSMFLFAMMAEVLAGSGIAAAAASEVSATLGRQAVLIVPPLAALFGVLTNSGTAGNSLFMASQVTLAGEARLPVPAVIALLHVAGSALSMFSPVRMAIACSLAGTPGQEGAAYRVLAPFAAAAFLVLMAAACAIAWLGYR